MRTSGVVAICLVCGLVSGCEEDARTAADRRLDQELVKTLNNIGVENAIITQHTLYPVPCMVIDEANWHLLPGGDLSSVAPTVLQLMGLQQPSEMTGKSLLMKEY